MRRFLLGLAMLMTGTAGAYASAMSDCTHSNDPDVKIRACTSIIEGRARGSRGLAYTSRVMAYTRKLDFQNALRDTNQLFQFAPNNKALSTIYTLRGGLYVAVKDYDLAIRDFQEAIKIDPSVKEARSMLDQAIQQKQLAGNSVPTGPAPPSQSTSNANPDCKQTTDLDLKLRACTDIVTGRVQGDKAYAFGARGATYLDKGQYDLAIDDMTQAIALSQSNQTLNSVAYAFRGKAYLGKKNYDQALLDLNQALQLNPSSADTYVVLSSVYLDKKDYVRGMANADRAIQLKPSLAEAYINRARAYSGQRKSDQAMTEINRAIQLNSSSGMAYVIRSAIYLDKKDFDQALIDANQAIHFSPSLPSAYYMRGKAYANKKDYDRAISDLDHAIQLLPSFSQAMMFRGAVHAAKSEHDQAIADADRAIQIDPSLAEAYSVRANSYTEKQNYDQALSDANQAIQLAPSLTFAYAVRCYVYLHRKEYDQAMSECNHALQLDPSSATAYQVRSDVYLKRKDYDQAMSDIEKALQLDPALAPGYGVRGKIYFEKQDYDRALIDLDRAIQLNPFLAEAYRYRGMAYMQKKNTDRAVEDLSKALRLNSYDTEASALLSQLQRQSPSPQSPRIASAPVETSQPSQRIALIISNQDYPSSIGRLTNPHHDGEVMKAALERIGFQVTHIKDADYVTLKQELAAYVGKLSFAGKDAVGFLYYAGHGMSDSEFGENYLIPAKTPVANDAQLPLLGVKLGEIASALTATKASVNFIIFDACRSVGIASNTRSATRGLSRIEPQRGLVVAYATEPGKTATDEGVFAEAMAEEIQKPGVEATTMFRAVTNRVLAATNDRQFPWIAERRTSDFYFVPAH